MGSVLKPYGSTLGMKEMLVNHQIYFFFRGHILKLFLETILRRYAFSIISVFKPMVELTTKLERRLKDFSFF